jgi:mitochondrial import receptor subunit TOM40
LLAYVWLPFSFATVQQFLLVTMAANSFAEKDAQPTTYASENLTAETSFSPLSPFLNVYNRFARWRSDLDLPQPGTIENLQKEIKGIVLSVPWPSFT